MKEIISRVTSKGQITIPAEIRRHLGVREGDTVSFVIEDSGAVVMQQPLYSSVDSLAGIAGTLPEAMSWDQLQEIAREEHVDEILRELE